MQDTGPGIPPRALLRVFEPFYTTKEVGQGTGLGLFLTYGIVSDHRGRVEVQNGHAGAIFTVVLPTVGHAITMTQEAAWESQAKS